MKRFAGFLLLCAITTLFLACKTTEPIAYPGSGSALGESGEVDRLRALYRDAIRVPITPQIVHQIKSERKEHLLGEIRYYTSVNIVLVRDRAGASSLTLETQELDFSEVQGALAQEGQAITILTFKEGGSLLNQSRIFKDDEGYLGSVSDEGDVFEIVYPERLITLGFVLNREKNWYDLEFAIEETGEGRVPLALTGVRPHLLIHYQTVFPEAGETRIQLDSTQVQPVDSASALPGQDTVVARPDDPSVAVVQPAADDPPVVDDPPPPVVVQPVVVQPVDDVPADQVVARVPDEPAQSTLYSPEARQDDPPGLEAGPPAVSTVSEAPAPGNFAADPLPEEDTQSLPDPLETVIFLEPAGETVFADPPETVPVPVISSLDQADDSGESQNFTEVVLIMGAPDIPDIKESRVPANCYTVQVGAFREQKNAALAYAILERGGFTPLYECYQDLTRVVIPAVEQKDLARTRERVKALGFDEPYVRR
ncbi:MAG: SPOR domain-containing protein [Treponema sp.]|jgi:hypothetical protein|nr:SPOR domain-containing protein [Treponema sp.]